jgi:hypothetical protein
MSLQLYLDKPIDDIETYRLAEATDLLYRKLRNLGYSRRYASAILPDEHTALQLAAVKIIKVAPIGEHPVKLVNDRNLVVMRAVTMSIKRVICLGTEGRVYPAVRGIIHEDGKFQPTAMHLTPGFMLMSTKRGRKMTRVARLKPSQEYIN